MFRPRSIGGGLLILKQGGRRGQRGAVDHAEATPGAVVENKLVTDLPLSARNWDDLLLTVAGVHGDRYTEEGGGTASGRTGNVNVNGARSLQNNFVLDGADNNSCRTRSTSSRSVA